MPSNCVQRFENIWKFLRFCSAYCGADVTKPDYRMTWLTWSLLVIIKCAFALTGYTAYVSLVIEGDRIGMLQCFCTLGNGLQGFFKLINCIYFKDQMRKAFEDLNDIYREYYCKHGGYKLSLEKSINRSSKALKYIAFVFSTAIISVFICPVFYYLIYGEKILILQFYFPGIDHNEKFGYIILAGIHIMCTLFAAFGNFSADMFFIIPVTHMSTMKDLFVCKLHDLNELLLEDTVDRQKTMEALKDILKWHQRYIRFIDYVKTSNFWIIAAVLVTNTLSIILALFCIIMGKWPGAYPYLLLCVIVLYTYCGLGTMVDIANDGFIDACYSDVLWYLLTTEEQKMLGTMLVMAQHPKCLTVADIAPLTMNTALQITKAVYTYTTVIIGFME